MRVTSLLRCSSVPPLGALVICGPSGVGKGALLTRLFVDYPSQFGYSVSHTTRAPRAGEVSGQHYHFVTHDAMKELQQSNYPPGSALPYFVESCQVHNEWYGTSRKALDDVRAQNRVVVLELDIQGAQKLKAEQEKLIATKTTTSSNNKEEAGGGAVALPWRYHYLFVTAPVALLEQRILARGADNPEKTQEKKNQEKKVVQ